MNNTNTPAIPDHLIKQWEQEAEAKYPANDWQYSAEVAHWMRRAYVEGRLTQHHADHPPIGVDKMGIIQQLEKRNEFENRSGVDNYGTTWTLAWEACISELKKILAETIVESKSAEDILKYEAENYKNAAGYGGPYYAAPAVLKAMQRYASQFQPAPVGPQWVKDWPPVMNYPYACRRLENGYWRYTEVRFYMDNFYINDSYRLRQE